LNRRNCFTPEPLVITGEFMLPKLFDERVFERAILSIRGEKVMLDSDLAELYGIETKREGV
jgi:hypothetical protein